MILKLPSYIRVVILLTVANLLVLAIRNVIVGDHFYSFLKSNLFIGSLPLIVIAFLMLRYNDKLSSFVFWIGTALWVLFYPNAPYMISDLIHNNQEPMDSVHKGMVIYDTMIIFSIAMLSVFYGFLSLKIMHSLFMARYGKKLAHTAIVLTLLLSCLGFYMGRELISAIKLGNGYLYSWELFLEPVQIIKIVWNALWPIQDHWPAYGMMVLFGIVQVLLLIIFSYVNDIEADLPVKK